MTSKTISALLETRLLKPANARGVEFGLNE